MTQKEIDIVQRYLDKKYRETPDKNVERIIKWLYDEVVHEKNKRRYSEANFDSNPCGEIPLTGEPPTVK